MEEKKYPVSDLMKETMDKIKAMVDVNTVVGEPIRAGEVTIIPISKVSFGLGVGGTDFATKAQQPGANNSFAGGGGAGMNIDPVSFLVIRGNDVRILPVLSPSDGAVDRLVELLPQVLDKVTDFLDKQKEKKDIQDF